MGGVAAGGGRVATVLIVIAPIQHQVGRAVGAGSITVPSSNAANWVMSWRFAPVITRAMGMPFASVSRWRLVPGLPRSVGLRPVACASPAPPFCRTGP